MYWNNIPVSILEGQKQVFEHLDIPLSQELAHKKPHGQWMNEVIARHLSSDVIIFCDIDAFPLSQEAYLHAVSIAESGGIFGLAQFSNHKKSPEIYAGPMFMAFRKSTWEQLGCPGLKSSDAYDAAEVMSVLAKRQGIPIEMLKPMGALIPKWALGNEGMFGIATFYGECEFFHLFESRRDAYVQLFDVIAKDVASGRTLNFNNYLEMAEASRLDGQQQAQKKSFSKRLKAMFHLSKKSS